MLFSSTPNILTELKIALWGAPASGQAELADELKLALKQLPTLAKTSPNQPQSSVLIEFFDTSTPEKLQTIFDLNFLMGLELAAAEPLARQKQSTDIAIRASLANAGTAYEVLYGSAQDRLAQALQAILNLLNKRLGMSDEIQPARPKRPWVWACEKCSDPVCEHRLLTDLLAKRPAVRSEPVY